MKVIYFNEAGDAGSVTTLGDFDKPVAGPGQVVVKMLGSVINPSDFLFISGTYRFSPQFPQIAGLEGAGIIESVADDVHLTVGSLVAFLARNTWAEFVCIDEKDVLVLPSEFPVEKAAQFALNPITAWGLLEKASLNDGDWIVIGHNQVRCFDMMEFKILG